MSKQFFSSSSKIITASVTGETNIPFIIIDSQLILLNWNDIIALHTMTKNMLNEYKILGSGITHESIH